MKLTRTPVVVPPLEAGGWRDVDDLHLDRNRYTFVPLECVCDRDVGFTDDDDIYVIPGITFDAHGAFTTSDPELFEWFTLFFPVSTAMPLSQRSILWESLSSTPLVNTSCKRHGPIWGGLEIHLGSSWAKTWWAKLAEPRA
jgi:hypothetical protein